MTPSKTLSAHGRLRRLIGDAPSRMNATSRDSDVASGKDENRGRRWLVLAPALVMPLLASLFYFVLFPGTAFGNAFYTGIKVFLLGWPLVASFLILRERLPREPGQREVGVSIAWAAAFGCFVCGLAALLFFTTPLGETVLGSGGRIRDRVAGLGVLDHYFLFGTFLCLIHSALEEYYWRWFVYGNLRRLMPRPWAHGLAAVGFASHHVVILGQFFPLGPALFFGACVGIGGLVWSLLLQRHRTLWGAWVSHMIIDVGILTLGWWLIF